MKTLILSFISLFFVFHIQAQDTKVVYGEVSTLNNLKLQNIIVESKKTGARSLTDSLGQFTVICEPKDALIFKSKVFKQKRVPVKPGVDSINAELVFIDHPDKIKLAIGYGYISPEKSTYAHDKLTKNNVNFCSYNSMYELIKGRFPGVNVSTINNAPGAEQSIKIRGINTINGNNTPLFVVDGVYVSSLNHIAPCDVESIDILKDASASIYGTRGANGVIIIETRN